MARGDGSEVNQSDGEVTLLCAPHSPSRVKRDQRKRRASKPARGWRWRESHRRPDEGRARGEPDRAGARGCRRDNVAGVGEVRRAGREAQCAGHGAGTLSSQRHLHDPIFACVASRSDDARPLAAGHRVRPLRRALRRGRARPLRRRRRGDLELGQRHVLGIARVCSLGNVVYVVFRSAAAAVGVCSSGAAARPWRRAARPDMPRLGGC